MILSDSIHRDQATGKFTILGTFSTLQSEEFPAVTQLCAYWAITDAEGDYTLTFRVVDSKHLFDPDIEPVTSNDFPISAPNPLAVCEGALGLKMVVPEPGVYHCELLIGDDLLMSRRLVALESGEISNEDS